LVCLDSDILISFLRGDEAAVNKIASLRHEGGGGGGGPLRTTVINAYELIKGATLSRAKEEDELQVRRLISELEVLDLDTEACESGASIFNHLKHGGATLNELDILIAGIVLRNRDNLVSRDKGFKRIPELRLDEW
jgi:tRNA(fMet)-specific endonuclease VapC